MAQASATPAGTPQITPEELNRVIAEIADRSARIASDIAQDPPVAGMARDAEQIGLPQAFAELGKQLWSDPQRLIEVQTRAWQDYMSLCQSTLKRFVGDSGAEPVKPTPKGDNRFRNEAWQSNFVFDHIRQTYLIAADHIQRTVAETQNLDPNSARKVRFFTRQIVDALAPTNFVMTNPEVLKATMDSGGRNLIDGWRNLVADLERGKGKLAIRMTDPKAFTLGENVAGSPGKVVFENDLMQLLQFEPTTPKVAKAPLLIVPPWINKYYILDLRASNSFIRWATDQGHTVFVISWVNPDERHVDKTFDDYLFEGPLAALDAIEDATGETAINLIGYCIGGTLTACTMSWLAKRGLEDRVKSVTYFTTMLDFSEPGDLGVFCDENSVSKLEARMQPKGYLEGGDMATTFNLLRNNDLIWSFVVNNYLLGKEPFPFDLLYWNSDATRMPAKMHMFYLRHCYLDNKLREPDAVVIGDEPVDLSGIKAPTCFVSTIEDHIAPWKSTYAGAKLMGGPVKFILGGSGHIAGIVNPPAAKKYMYWLNDGIAATPEAWLETAQRHEGSWWDHWQEWVGRFSGGQVPARKPGDGKLKVIEAAPGRYARFRLDTAHEAAGGASSKAKPSITHPMAGAGDLFATLRAMAEKVRETFVDPVAVEVVPEGEVAGSAAAKPAARAAAPAVAPATPAPSAPPAPAKTPAARKAAVAKKAKVAKAKVATPQTAKPKVSAPKPLEVAKAAKAVAEAAPANGAPKKSAKPVKPAKVTKPAKSAKPAKAVTAASKSAPSPGATAATAGKSARGKAKAATAGGSAAAISALFHGRQTEPAATPAKKSGKKGGGKKG
jgi:polyhydroxyalkanoate synthase